VHLGYEVPPPESDSYAFVEGVWLVAGAASPGPSWTDWTRGQGGAAHLWVMSNQAHRLKQPPPHTHTQD